MRSTSVSSQRFFVWSIFCVEAVAAPPEARPGSRRGLFAGTAASITSVPGSRRARFAGKMGSITTGDGGRGTSVRLCASSLLRYPSTGIVKPRFGTRSSASRSDSSATRRLICASHYRSSECDGTGRQAATNQ